MLPLVLAFTAAKLICVIAMQFTEFRTTASDLVVGLTPDFPVFVAFAALALAAYGYTALTLVTSPPIRTGASRRAIRATWVRTVLTRTGSRMVV